MFWGRRSGRSKSVETWSDEELFRRMRRPQRHRLLQGYPMVRAMQGCDLEEVSLDEARLRSMEPNRGLIVGVLPHTFCNPKIEGCGFCTFPHERYRRLEAQQTCAAVCHEIEAMLHRAPFLEQRRVEAVYLGGGTANLAAPDDLAKIVETLARAFDIRQAELTLEGAPVYFLTDEGAHLRQLASLAVRQPRISMGVQTFDRSMLKAMGRDAIGAPEHVEEVARRAQALGLTVSVDLLYNLPGQSREEMLEDVRRAAELGVEQICVYHLVLFEGVGSTWSRIAALIDAVPQEMEHACENWLAVREELQGLGYLPTTLTNFERADVQTSARRFVYELCSFNPACYDALGFGPGALSTVSHGSREALKVMNAPTSVGYRAQIDLAGHGATSTFTYDATDMKLLHLTRQLSRGGIHLTQYQARFGEHPTACFKEEIEACQGAKLLAVDEEWARLTPRGFFYADSVAGLLASRRLDLLFPDREGLQDVVHDHMG